LWENRVLLVLSKWKDDNNDDDNEEEEEEEWGRELSVITYLNLTLFLVNILLSLDIN